MPPASITELASRRPDVNRCSCFRSSPEASWHVQYVDAASGTPERAAAIQRLREALSIRWLACLATTREYLARQVSAAVCRRDVDDRVDEASVTIGCVEVL